MDGIEQIRNKYLVTNDSDNLWGLTVDNVGMQRIEPSGAYPPISAHPDRYLFSQNQGRVLAEYQLVYITQGSGLFKTRRSERTTVNEGVMLLLYPGEWHTYMPLLESGWTEYWIGFHGFNMDSRVANGFFTKNIFQIGLREEIVDLYNKAIESATNQQSGYQQILAGIVNYIIGLTYTYDKNRSFEKETIRQIDRARVIMRERIMEKITPEEVAANLNMSYSWFRKLFREYTGFSPTQYLLEIRMQMAKDLLLNSQLNVKEIAFQLNYESAEYFSTQFKKKTGKTPLEFRSIFVPMHHF